MNTTTMQFTRDELTAICNVINHALRGGFVITKEDCHTITSIEWDALQELELRFRNTLPDSSGTQSGVL